jgi:hypothetical protein
MADEVSLPPLPSPSAGPDELRDALRALILWAQARDPLGDGSGLDKFLTGTAALSAGLLTYSPGAGVSSGSAAGAYLPGPATSTPSDASPPTPIAGLTVAAGVAHNLVQWGAPTYTQGGGNGRTIIYAANYSGAGPLPTFENAVEVGTAPGRGTILVVDSEPGVQVHYWAKAETRHPTLQASPTGGLNGVTSTADLIEDQHIVSLSVAKLIAGSIGVSEFIESTGYVPNTSGWHIDGDGTAEFADVLIRGVLQASIIKNAAGVVWLDSNNTSTPPWVVNGVSIGGGIELTEGVSATNTVELRSIKAGDGMNAYIDVDGAVVLASKSSDDSAIRLDGDVAVSSTTVASVPDFVLALEANSFYRIEGTLRYQSAAATTGIKIGGTLPTTAKGIVRITCNDTQSTVESRLLDIPTGGSTQSVAMSATWAAAAGAPGSFSSSDDAICTLEGILETGADAGAFQLSVGSEVGASTITLRSGSVMLVEKVNTEAIVGGTIYTLDGTPGFDTDYEADSASVDGKPRTAGLRITLDESGNWTVAAYGTGASLVSGTPTSGTWAASPGAGAGSQWQVKFTTVSQSTGDASIGNGASSYQSLSSLRSYAASVSSSLGDSPFTDVVEVNISMRNVASGAVTALATVTLTVTASTT